MKTKKLYFRIRREGGFEYSLNRFTYLFYLCALLAIALAGNVHAQNIDPQYVPLPIPGSYRDGEIASYSDEGADPDTNVFSTTPAYSPSIVSFKRSSSEWLVSAYVYRKDHTHRTVGFARSTDGGTTWNKITKTVGGITSDLNLPAASLGSIECTNYDEPQITAIGDTLICVVRGWPDVTSAGGGIGNRYHEQQKSIPSKSGIFIFISRNQGDSWGYYNSAGMFVPNLFGKIDGHEGADTVSLEHPRIAYRTGFDDKGYIVWQRKKWSGGTGDLRVSESKIGVRAIKGNTSPTNPIGKLYTFLSENGAPYYTGLNNSTGGMGAELPSVAISPDQQFWVGYVVPNYSPASGTGFDAEVFNGRQSPSANWKLISGFSEVVTTSGTDLGKIKFHFSASPTLVGDDDGDGVVESQSSQSEEKFIQGIYDPRRGYFYGYDSSAHDLSTNNIRGDIISLETGPSVQVAVNNPLNCNSYHVGYLFASGNSTEMNSSGFMNSLSTLNFYCAYMKDGGTSDDWLSKMVKVSPNGGSDSLVNHIDYVGSTCYDCNIPPSSMTCGIRSSFFPVLKYVNYNDPYLNKEVFSGDSSFLPRSYFTLAYMYLRRSVEETSPSEYISRFSDSLISSKYDSVECRTAFSWDNEHFFVTRYDTDSTDEVHESMRKACETVPICGAVALIDQKYWGKQIDICGEFGNFRVHPIWHRIQKNMDKGYVMNNVYASEGVKTNTAECIIIRPLLDDHVANDQEGLPSYFNGDGTSVKSRFISTTLDYEDSTDHYRWAPYVYFNYMNTDSNWIQRPTGASVNGMDSSSSDPYQLLNPIGIRGDFSVDYTNKNAPFSLKSMFNGDTNLLARSTDTSSTVIPNGIYYANYRGNSDDFGALFFSNQRKFVMTGNYVHGVFERDGNVFYSMNRYDKSTTSPDWIKVIPLDTVITNPDITRSRPSIAVYQLGDDYYDFCGLGAIGITWKEVNSEVDSEITVSLKFRTREFNLCTGEWLKWSDIYTIHSHTFDATDEENIYFGFSDDSTTSVIAPILTPDSVALAYKDANTWTTYTIPTHLLGWTVTWTSPKLTDAGVVDQSFNKFIYGVYSRSILRGLAVPGDLETFTASWGNYPNIGTCSSCLIPKNTDVGLKANKIYVPSQTTKNFPLGYPTVVSSENKTEWRNNDTNYSQEVAFSTLGVDVPSPSFTPKKGIWHKIVRYHRSGDSLGYMKENSSFTNWLGDNVARLSPPSKMPEAVEGDQFDRNPCITINSTGQTFIAWESLRSYPGFVIATLGGSQIFTFPPTMRSYIVSNHTHFLSNSTHNGNWWGTNNKSNVKVRVSETIPEMKWQFLLNPSIAGFPKSRWPDISIPDIDMDPSAVQLLYWRYIGKEGTLPFDTLNNLHGQLVFSEGPGDIDLPARSITKQKGLGAWRLDNYKEPPTIFGVGTNSHFSFGTYNGGPTFDSIPDTGSFNKDNFFLLKTAYDCAYPFGNHLANINEFTSPASIAGAYKGTFIDTVGITNYRFVDFVKDSVMGSFVWGDVIVGADTLNPTNDRAVLLHLGVRDSGAYSSFNELMDSVFQTEIFDWYPNTEISYMRGLYVTDSNGVKPGGVFYDSSLYIKFTVELVSGSHIDTIETAILSPANGYYPIPLAMHIPNGDTLIRDVSLRVRIGTYGVTIPDSMWEFSDEFTDNRYETLDDSTTVAYKRSGKTLDFKGDSKLYISAPYPNPGQKNQPVLFRFAYPHGELVTITVFDVLGRNLIPPTTIESSGYWQEYPLPPIISAGTYYISITSGNERKTLPFVITE